MTEPKRTIYYDGLCQLCSREIGVVRRRVTDGSLAYVDIADPGFDAVAHGVDADRVNKHMHVRDEATGRMLIGVDALIDMWERVPGFRWLAALARLPVLRQLAEAGYAVFAWVRPKLPKRAACDSGAVCGGFCRPSPATTCGRDDLSPTGRGVECRRLSPLPVGERASPAPAGRG